MRGGRRGAPGGFSMVEILIVVAIVGILTMIATESFRAMMEKARVEGETKQLYADLMEARARAMQRDRVTFFRVGAGALSYRTFEDTNPAPDGDGALNQALDAAIASKTLEHAVSGVSSIDFNRNGIASVSGTIRFSSTAKPDYDCITVGATRIKMGQYDTSAGKCNER